jgi:hypothetical protein
LAHSFKDGDVICASCRTKAYREKTLPVNGYESDEDQNHDSLVFAIRDDSDHTELIELPIQRTISTHGYCFICSQVSNLRTVPKKAWLQVYTQKGIYVPTENRCCHSHLINDQFYQDDLDKIKVYCSTSTIKLTDITQLFQSLAVETQLTVFDKINNRTLSDDDLLVLVGLTWKNVDKIQNMLVTLRNNLQRSTLQAIIVFLIKLRTASSNKLISKMLQMPREQTVSDYVDNVIASFERDVLPHQFGIDTHTRQWLIENHTYNRADFLTLEIASY